MEVKEATPACPKLLIPCNSLKRKRPPTIEIPNLLQQVKTSPLLTPVPNDAVCFEGFGYGVSAVKGKKKFMEDTHKVLPLLDGNPTKGFFGVYDGHGGRSAAEFAAENLHANILEAVAAVDGGGGSSKEEAVKAAYLKTDQAFLQKGLVSGACCVTALIEGRELVISNAGDCRAVLSRGGLAEALTRDHRAECEDERKRIENKGGYVEIHRGGWRVHGVLSVSRSIGDSHLKDWVIAEPETTILPLTPDMEFLILASDGLWEKVGNQEAIDIVQLCMPYKKCGPAIDSRSDGNIVYSGTTPSVKVPRISVVRKKNKPRRTPNSNRVVHGWINRKEEFVCGNQRPPLKSRRISLVKRASANSESDTDENIDPNREEDIVCENQSPPLKSRRISLVKRASINSESATNKNTDSNIEEDSVRDNRSPPLKSRRISLVKRASISSESATDENADPNRAEDLACENQSPSLKSRRISQVKRVSISSESPTDENTDPNRSPRSEGLAAASKKLVNLAVSRGSLDDITVVIIDFSRFQSSS